MKKLGTKRIKELEKQVTKIIKETSKKELETTTTKKK